MRGLACVCPSNFVHPHRGTFVRQNGSPIAIWEVKETLDGDIDSCGLGAVAAYEDDRLWRTDIPVREEDIVRLSVLNKI